MLVLGASLVWAGISRELQNEYVQKYKNRAMFLKIPVHGMRQVVLVGERISVDRSNANQPISFKVGEQVRILDLKFDNWSILFKLAAVDMSKESELIYRFSTPLTEEFPNKQDFDSALENTLTPGLSYTEIDSAKEQFIKDQFDHLIEQFATSTGTTPDFVIKTISEKNPEYRRAQAEAREARERLQEVQAQSRDESKARREAETALANARRELSQVRSNLATIRDERTQLASEKTQLQREVAELRARNQEYDKQVNSLLSRLGIETDARANLGTRVEAVNRSFASLRTERSDLSQKLSQVTKEMETLRATNQKLDADLKQAQQQNSRLSKQLSSLTSDRNSLEARYLRTMREREILEDASRLARALRWEKRFEKRDDGDYEIQDVYLKTQKIGSFEIRAPLYPGDTGTVVFSVLSPDTVQFTEEERELHQLLGEKLKIEATWTADSPALKPVSNSSATQEIPIREKGEWSWQFQGDPSEPARTVFQAHLTDKNGQIIPLTTQEFWVYPGNFLDRLKRSFSFLWFGIGAALAAAVLSTVWLAGGGRSRRPRTVPAREADYVAPKRL